MLTGIRHIFENHRKNALGQKSCEAAVGGNFLNALALIDQGADVNYIGHTEDYAESRIDVTVAHKALQVRNMTVFKELLKRGLDVNLTLKEDAKSLLTYALQTGNAEAAQLLVERGADLSFRTKALETPLDLARKRNIRLGRFSPPVDMTGMEEVARLIQVKLQQQGQKAPALRPERG